MTAHNGKRTKADESASQNSRTLRQISLLTPLCLKTYASVKSDFALK